MARAGWPIAPAGWRGPIAVSIFFARTGNSIQRARLSRRSALLGGNRYAVARRGDRFLVNQSTSDRRASAIIVVIGPIEAVALLTLP
jgi:hypothetical protein